MDAMLGDIPLFLEIFIIVLAGLLLGSFATAMTYRVPRRIPWAFGGGAGQEQSVYFSACPHCQHRLGALDLIPIISWLLRRGRCAHCAAPIGYVYPLIELSVLLACLAAYAAFGFSYPLIWIVLAVPFLVALFAIDLEYMILPNQLVAILAGLGMFYHCHGLALNEVAPHEALINFGGGALFYGASIWLLSLVTSKILKKDALGFGDVKFFAVSGLWLGLNLMPYFFIASGLFGALVAIIWEKVKGEAVFPFGPALIISFFVLFVLNGSHLLEFIVK